jgi:hypothetical protein
MVTFRPYRKTFLISDHYVILTLYKTGPLKSFRKISVRPNNRIEVMTINIKLYSQALIHVHQPHLLLRSY